MTKSFILGLALFLFCCGVSAAESPGTASPHRLTCFSVEPPKAGPNRKHEDYRACDDLCAERGAVCAGMQNGGMNPPITCADRTASTWAVCRCCKVQK